MKHLTRTRRRPRRSRRHLSLQSLENRHLLAGNVLVDVSRGDLLLEGDTEANQLLIERTEDGATVVSGLEGTTINGSDAPFIATAGQLTDDLNVRLNDGDDVLSLLGIYVADDLRISAGAGNDTVLVQSTNVGDRLAINGGRDDDLIVVAGSSRIAPAQAPRVSIHGGDGANSIQLSNLSSSDAVLRSGRGADDVGLSNVAISDDLFIATGSGNDDVGITDTTVADDTSISLGSRFSRWWHLRDDDDRLLIEDSTHADRVKIGSGGGDDYLGIAGVDIEGRVSVSMGAGADEVGVGSSTFGNRLAADGGWGNDSIEVYDDANFDLDPRIRRFENRQVEDVSAKNDAILDDLRSSNALPAELESIADIVIGSDDFETLEVALGAAGLVETLDGEGTFTVFAPTDDAFAALPDGTLETLLADPAGELTEVLLYHVLGAEVTEDEVITLDAATTLLGEDLAIEVTDAGVILNESVLITETDIVARNGIVHVIDAVLIPPEDGEGSGGDVDDGGEVEDEEDRDDEDNDNRSGGIRAFFANLIGRWFG